MIITYEKYFKKQFKKLPVKVQNQFQSRLSLFIADSSTPMLHVHPLNGKFKGYWSINISGDFRALYRQDGDVLVIFALIGTHSQLYG